MKKFLLTSFAVLGIAGTASAADLAVRAPIIAPVLYSWTGCYIGGHGGYGKGQSSHNVQFDDVSRNFNTAEFYFTNNFDNQGGVYGLQGGCDYQLGRFVFGIEGDYSWANLHKSYSFADSNPTDVDTASFSSKVKNIESVRGRFGIADDRALVYVTMGPAWAKLKYEYFLNDNGTTNAASYDFDSKTGIVVGAGAQYALTDWFILRAEYLHYAFNTDNVLAPSFLTGPGFNDHVTLKDVDVIRLGADWKFTNWLGWGAPVARY